MKYQRQMPCAVCRNQPANRFYWPFCSDACSVEGQVTLLERYEDMSKEVADEWIESAKTKYEDRPDIYK